jgi:hypothetical protein
MTVNERTGRVLDRAARGEADIGEIEECISATRADLDRNLSAIEQRLSPDELINQAVDYLRSGPTEFLSNFGQAVKSNPVPAALMTVSVAWLMFGGRAHSNGAGRAAYSGSDAADQYGDDGLPVIGESENLSDGRDGSSAVRRVTETVRERASRLGDRASSVASRASQLADRASSVGDRMGHKFSEVGGKMTDASKHAQEVFQTARERIAQARETLGQQPRRIKAGYQDVTENHPFVLGALAFVAGAAIAASLRRTQIENEVLGEYRDGALDEAGRRARAELQRGVATAKSALNSSEDENSPDDQMEMEIEGSDQDTGQKSESATSGDTSSPQRESQDRFH